MTMEFGSSFTCLSVLDWAEKTDWRIRSKPERACFLGGWRFHITVIRRLFIFIGLLMLAVPLLAQNAPAPASDYHIGPRDLLDVKVDQDPTLNTQERVGADGRFPMPLIGPVYVSGMTPDQVQNRIASLLAEKYITNPSVSVVVKEFESEALAVFGEVRTPGKIPVLPNMTLLQAISAAGGLAPNHGATIQVLRVASNGLTDQIEIGVDQLMASGNPDFNIPVQPEDVINIPADPQISISLLGEVMKQGVVTFKASDAVTLLRAIAAAGGLTDRASTRNIVVIRSTDGREQRLTFNLGRILAGKDPDPELRADDKIFVRESFF